MANSNRPDCWETITVLVGHDEKPCAIHPSAFTARSTFFRAAVEGGFREAKDKVIRLPEVDEDIWATYFHWIYSGEVVPLDEEQIEHDESGVECRNRLINLYILADVVDDMALRNEVVDQFQANFDKTNEWTCDNIVLLLDSTTKKSKLRSLMVDYALCTRSDTADFLESNCDAVPLSFQNEILVKLLSGECGRWRQYLYAANASLQLSRARRQASALRVTLLSRMLRNLPGFEVTGPAMLGQRQAYAGSA